MSFAHFPTGKFVRHSRPNDVLALFRRMIRDRRVRPGERLPNERDLARHLGISRPSLREAVRALAAMNILEVRQGSGTYVTSLDPELLAEPLELILAIDASAILALFELRRIIEPRASALAAQRATRRELVLLRAELERGASVQHRPDALIDHDTALHRLVHQAAHNPLLLSVSASLAALARTSRLRTVQLPENARLTIKEHRAIVDAICARRADQAAKQMLSHLQRIERQLRSAKDDGGRDWTGSNRAIGAAVRAARTRGDAGTARGTRTPVMGQDVATPVDSRWIGRRPPRRDRGRITTLGERDEDHRGRVYRAPGDRRRRRSLQ